MLEAWADDAILPHYGELVTRTAALGMAVDALCAGPSEARLADARQAWMDAREPWEEAEVFTFGPLLDFPLRLLPLIEFRPTRVEAVAEIIDGDQVLSLEEVRLFGAPGRGFPALEVLLFTTAVTDFVADERRCQYSSVVAADLQANAQRLLQAWAPTGDDYRGQLVNAGAGSEAFPSLQEAVAKVVNRMWQHVEKIREIELGKPVGLDGGPVSEDGVESRLSGRSLVDVTDTLAGIAMVYEGVGDGLGLRDLLLAEGKNFDEEFRARMSAGVAAVEAIGPPLTSAIVERPQAVRDAVDALADLQRLIQVDFMGSLSLSLTFNDSDGD